MTSQLHYRADIDGLRALAVLGVVGYHAFPQWFQGGFVGVDVFFVISGYLITSIILRNLGQSNFSFTDFYARRIRRIFPALIPVMLAVLVFGWYIPPPTDFKIIGEHTTAAAGFFSNIVYWRESNYFDRMAFTKLLLHTWSLAVEEQFYIAWPLVMWCLWKKKISGPAACGVLIFLSFLFNLYSITTHHHATAFYNTAARFWELTLGSLLAYTGLQTSRSNTKSILGLALIALSIAAPIPTLSFPGWFVLAPTFGAYFLIAAGPNAWVNRHILSHRLFVSIGLISYPLYLWHWPLLSFYRIYGHAVPYGYAIIIFLSIVLASLTYILIEKPIRFGGHAKAKTLILCAVMIVLGCVGHSIYNRDGLPERFPESIRRLLNFNFDYDTAWRVKGGCFLDTQGPEFFKPCTDGSTTAPSLLLWGDSLAASIYPGVKKVFGPTHRVTELVARACPPIIGHDYPDNPKCPAINRYVLERIRSEKIERVVLVGSWERYDDWKNIDITIQTLRKLGVKRIDMVGGVPEWKATPVDILYRYYRLHPNAPLPFRLGSPYVNRHTDSDAAVAAYAKQVSVHYISAASILCNAEGCLARLSDEPDSITAWTSHHLTAKAAEYLVEHFPK